jgi:thiamine pyrophosphate-dependent acetolactate synthase large subunit-like protein
VVQVDVRGEHIGRRVPVDVPSGRDGEETVAALADEDAVFLADVGSPTLWAARHLA